MHAEYFRLERRKAKSPCRKFLGGCQSLYGRYDKDKNLLWLGGDVQIFHDKGFQSHDELQADMTTTPPGAKNPCLFKGDSAKSAARGFRLLDGGKVIVVNGPAPPAYICMAAKPLINPR